VPTQS